MAKKGALFHLIGSMTPAEKRYFRLSAQKESSVYLQLFRAIERQEEYDEAALRKQFRNAPFTRQLHVAKNYLTSLIMRALRNYHAGGSAKQQVVALVQDAEILLGRELYDHCHYTLEKAWQLTTKHAYHAAQLEVLDLRRRLLLARGEGQARSMADVLQAEASVLEKCLHLNRTWALTNELLEKIRQKDFLELPQVSRQRPQSSVRSETLRRHMRYSWYFMNGERRKAEREVDALLRMLRELPEYISEEPGPYVTALGNKISMLLGEKRWKETEALLREMRGVPDAYKLKRNSRFTLRLWLRQYNLELEYYRDADKKEAALKLVKEISGFLAARAAALPLTYVLLFRFQFALVHFGAGDLKASLREVNEIINGDFGQERSDLQCTARLLNLVIHFELGNILVLRYAVDSAERFLLKHKALQANEKVLLGLFKKLSRGNRREYFQLFGSASGRLRQPAYDYFDFKGWVEGCLGNLSRFNS